MGKKNMNNPKKKDGTASSSKDADKIPKADVWLRTNDGSIQKVEHELAIHIPFVYQKIFSGMVSSEDHPIPLPASVCDLPLLDLLLEHFRFSQARGHSQKEIASYQVKLFRELIPALNNLLLREDVKVEEDVEVGTSDLDNKMKLLPIEDDELTTEEEKAIDRDVEYFVSSLNKRWPERMLEIVSQGQQRRPSQWIIDTSRRLHD